MLATLMPDSSRTPAVGIDLGGTTIKAALVTPDYEIIGRGQVPTDLRSQRALLDAIERLVASVSQGTEVLGVGFGLPSQIDQRAGRVLDSTNVPLEDLDFVEEMQGRLAARVMLDNDANVACLAEARIGAARGCDHAVMLTLGTGIGGGLWLDGRLYRGAIGAGAELGHMSIAEDGPRCQGHCPNRGCLEVLASATGVMWQANNLADENPGSRLAAAREKGGDLDPRTVIDLAKAGDEHAVEAMRRVGRHLGVGIANYVNIFDPEVVVVGGGVSAAGDLLLGPAREESQRRSLPSSGSVARLVIAELGNDAGVLGAAGQLFE
jgi:glucokinase